MSKVWCQNLVGLAYDFDTKISNVFIRESNIKNEAKKGDNNDFSGFQN